MNRPIGGFFKGAGAAIVGQVIRMSDSVPVDYQISGAGRYLRGGYIETNPALFDNSIWADSVGTLWRETYRDSAPQSNSITGAFYVNNTFFVVFQNSASGLKSLDGINWTSVTFGTSGVTTLAYGAGLYVSGHQNGSIYYSSDLTSWTVATGLPITNRNNSLVFANSLFVMGGEDGKILTSSNGISWASRSSTFTVTQDVNSIVYAFGLFVASGGEGPASYKIATSPDGINWTNRVISSGAANAAIEKMAFNGTRLVGIQSNIPLTGYFQLVYSNDGITWFWSAADDFNNSVQETVTANSYGWGSANIASAGGKFYAGRMRSVDGLKWEYISTAYTIGFFAGDSTKIVCAGYRTYRIVSSMEDSDPSRSISLSSLSAGLSESIHEGGTEQYVRIS